MTLSGIAYGPDEHVLLTFDEREVLAHDAQTEAPKWRLALDQPVVSLAFADPQALPGAQGGSPWRNAAGRIVIAVDAAGALHTIDPAAGQSTSKHGPFGKPLAFAVGVAGAGAVVALGTEDRLHLWRGGEHTEIPGRSSAIAISNDGATLAIGAVDGSLRFLSISGSSKPVETFCAVVHGGITDLVQHPGGTWIVSGKSGISTVTPEGPQRLASLPADVARVRLDGRGRRLAAQLGDRTVAVYTWPSLDLVTRIEYVERRVSGLAFGPGDWLGLGLDHGDGNKIDVVTSATHRTDTHPGRTHRSWLLSVRGKASMLSAKEAEDVRRMKDPFHAPAPQKNPGGYGARVGLGAGISILLLFVRLCAVGSRHSSPTYTTYPPYTAPTYDPLASPLSGSAGGSGRCDRACAKQRLEFLREQCPSTSALCTTSASAALSAFADGDCKSAKAALARIGTWPSSGDSSRDLLGRAGLSIAVRGLADACSSSTGSSAGGTRHASLVRLTGPTLQVNSEAIPAASFAEGETPGVIWAAPDGTIFVSTKAGPSSSNVHRRDKSGVWSVIGRRRSTRVVQFWGKSASDLTFMDVDSLAHWDGQKSTEIAPPPSPLSGLGAIGDELFVASEAVDTTELQRRKGTGPSATWTNEPLGVDGVIIRKLHAGNGTLWATAADRDDSDADPDHLLVRTGSGRWVEKKWFGATKPVASTIRSVWVSPSNDAFVATDSGIYRSTGGGSTWARSGTQTDVENLWGRSNGDVYATSASGLLHYDGKTWTTTKYTGSEMVIGGTATEVILMGTSTDD
jgi:hypothetical protein